VPARRAVMRSVASLSDLCIRVRAKAAGVLIGSLSVAFAFEITASQFKGGLRPPVHRSSLMLLWHLPLYQIGQPFG